MSLAHSGTTYRMNVRYTLQPYGAGLAQGSESSAGEPGRDLSVYVQLSGRSPATSDGSALV